MEVTSLYLEVVMYDVYENELFIAKLPVNDIELSFYNNDYNGCHDLKQIKFKGKVDNNSQGSVLLGSL